MENIPDTELINTTRQKYKLIATDINSAHKLASELIRSGNIEEAAALLFFSFLSEYNKLLFFYNL